MALPTTTISLEYTSITSDRKTAVFTDNTDFTDPIRSAVNVYFEVDKMKVDNTVDEILSVTGNTGDPATDTSWSVTRPTTTDTLKDGWTRGKYVAIPDYDVGTTYSIYQAASSAGVVYRSLQNGNVGNSVSDTDWWEVITLPADLSLNKGEANESTNIASLLYEVQIASTLELAYGNITWQLSQVGGEADREENVDNQELLGIWLDGLYLADDRSEHPQGEAVARRAQSVSEQLGLI